MPFCAHCWKWEINIKTNRPHQTLDSPSMCLPSVGLTGDCVSDLPRVQVYVMGWIPTARQGRITEAPILQLTWPVKFTMMGLTVRKGEERKIISASRSKSCLISISLLHKTTGVCKKHTANKVCFRKVKILTKETCQSIDRLQLFPPL